MTTSNDTVARGAPLAAANRWWSTVMRAARRVVGPALTADPQDAVWPTLQQYPYGPPNAR